MNLSTGNAYSNGLVYAGFNQDQGIYTFLYFICFSLLMKSKTF